MIPTVKLQQKISFGTGTRSSKLIEIVVTTCELREAPEWKVQDGFDTS
jgi:hypothetical protein